MLSMNGKDMQMHLPAFPILAYYQINDEALHTMYVDRNANEVQ
jgi:hypothetical protein